MLSERGSIGVDDRTNTLLVQDTAERLQDIRRMVRTLDIPIKQVLIESRIVVVNDDFSRDLGMRLGVTGFNEDSGDLIVTSGTGTGTDTMIGSALDNLADPANGTVYPIEVPLLTDRYNVNVPICRRGGPFLAGGTAERLPGRSRADGSGSRRSRRDCFDAACDHG